MASNRNLELAILIRTEVGKALRDFKKTSTSIDGTERSTRRLKDSNEKLSKSYGFLRNAVIGFVSFQTAREIIRIADSYNVLQQRIKTATRESGDYEEVSKEILRISRENHTALNTTVDAFQRTQISAAALGASSDDVLKLTDVVQKLGKIGGSTGEALKTGQVQFVQALAEGIFRAEEAKSIVESLPLLATKIEKGLGLLPGEFKKAVREGKVLSRDVMEVLLKQFDEIRQEKSLIPASIADEIQDLRTNIAVLINDLDESTELTKSIADGIGSINDALEEGSATEFLDTMKDIGVVIGSLALAKIFGGAVTAALVFTAALTNVNRQLLLAQVNAGRAAAGLGAMRAVMGVLGGPGGLIILAASAIAFFASKANEGAREAADFHERVKQLTESAGDLLSITHTEGLQNILVVSRKIDEIEDRLAKSRGRNRAGLQQQLTRLRNEESLLKRDLALLANQLKKRKPDPEQGNEGGDESKVIDTTRARVDAETKVLKEGLQRQLRNLDQAQEQNLISFADFYRERARIQTEAIDAEIKRTQASLAEANKAAASGGNEKAVQSAKEKQIQLESELIILRQKRADVAVTAAQGEAQAEKELAAELEQVRIRLLGAQGKTAEARTAAVEAEFKGLLDRLKIEADPAGEALIKKVINVESARAELDALEASIGAALSRLAQQESSLSLQREAGLLTEREVREQAVGLHEATAEQLRQLIPQYEALVNVIDDPRAREALEDLKTRTEELSVVIDERAKRINDAMQAGLTDGLENAIDGTGELGDAFDEMGDRMIATIKRILAEQAAQAIIGSLGLNNIGNIFASVLHEGGDYASAPKRATSPYAFINAPRLHSGLRQNEFAAILDKEEEVLTPDSPFHSKNLGRNGGSQDGPRRYVVSFEGDIGNRLVRDVVEDMIVQEQYS